MSEGLCNVLESMRRFAVPRISGKNGTSGMSSPNYVDCLVFLSVVTGRSQRTIVLPASCDSCLSVVVCCWDG
jgi:hypothetical protein